MTDEITKEAHEMAKEVIKKYESLRLEAYLDPVGVPTIGWGTTHYPNGKRVKIGDAISESEAEACINHDMHKFEEGIKAHVKYDLNEKCDAALISFTYNLGLGNLYSSHLLTYINEGKPKIAANEFPKWCHAGGKVLRGLVRRRSEEQDLFKQGLIMLT